MENRIGELVIKSLVSALILIVNSYWPILALFLIFFTVLVFYQQYRYRKSDIYAVDKMSGCDFEQFLVSLFQRLGYKTEHIGKLGDYGGDLIIEKDGIKTLVQSKRLSSNVRESAVQQAIAAKENYHCDKAMVVTNQFFWKHAWVLAKNTNVILWTRNDLIMKIAEAKAQEKENKK
jgi:restriction system protein